MFADLPIERELFGTGDLLPGLVYWIESAGGYATVGLFLWFVIGLTLMKRMDRQRIHPTFATLFVCFSAIAFVAYPIYYASFLIAPGPQPKITPEGTVILPPATLSWRDVIGGIGGFCALFAVAMPLANNLMSLSLRRIGGLARLSFKEAIRRRVLWVIFSILAIVFLFAGWFVPYKPEQQVRNYVMIADRVMTPLLLVTAALLASFSIPTDIKQQTIHTILTKPVERFEIVLGRILGYSALMTLVLIAMTGLSLLYLVRQIDPEAAAESLKARDPAWGELQFAKGELEFEGVNVGKEWGYRSYIYGPEPGQPTHSAIWRFPTVSTNFANRKSVRAEFTFDIFRSTKGTENRGISCGFYFRTWRYKRGNEKDYQKELEARRAQSPRPPDADILNELTEKYGYYEVPATAVSSGHTDALDLLAGLFANINKGPDDERRRESEATKKPLPALKTRVTCNSVTQYVGMAKYDFWLRQDDPNSGNDKLLFSYNFFKAQAVNLWLKVILVIGVAVALSTYLSGVITLLVTGVLYFGGIILNFMQSVAYNANVGGGPIQAMVNLAQQGKMPSAEKPTGTMGLAVLVSDEFVRFCLRRVLDLFPDVERFDFMRFVQEGFNIPASQIPINFLLMAAYVLPWIVLAYYLMKWKEVASAT